MKSKLHGFLRGGVLALVLFVATALHAASSKVVNFPEIGPHYPILIVEKNVNPENKMVAYTKMDAKGRFLDVGNRPVVDFYWLMDGKKYKPVNKKILKELHKQFTWQWNSKDRSTFVVEVNDLKKMKCDIKERRIDVSAAKTHDGTHIETQMNLGPSDGNMRIRLSAIQTVGRAFPPSAESVTLKGEKVVKGKPTGKKVTRTYYATDHR